MLSILKNVSNEIIINKSKFITYLIRIDDFNDIKAYLDKLKLKYKDSTHICYAYIFENFKKCSDDNEPSGTAGMPILNVLESNNLDHILCVVIRYFGGIKLGAGGLVRAYSNSASKTINSSNICEIIDGKLIKLEFNYDDVKKIDFILKSYDIKKEYNELISYTFDISNKEFEKIYDELKKMCKIEIIKEKKVKNS